MLDIILWLALVFFSEFALVSFYLGPGFQDAKVGVGYVQDFASALKLVQATKHKAWLESKSANKKKRKVI